MPVKVSVQTAQVDALFQRMGWTIKNSVPGYLRQEARLAAVSLAFQTQPFGDNATTKASGEAAVSRDIYRVYTTPGKAFEDIQDKHEQAGFWKAVKTSAWGRAATILARSGVALKSTLIDNFDGGASHRQLRNNRGGINQGQKPVMIVKDAAKLKSYIKFEQKKVGEGKGGWATCARNLGGTRGIPGWVSRQNSPGQVIENYAADKSSVSMTNLVPYASEILTQSAQQDALRIAEDKLRKSIMTALRHIP